MYLKDPINNMEYLNTQIKKTHTHTHKSIRMLKIPKKYRNKNSNQFQILVSRSKC